MNNESRFGDVCTILEKRAKEYLKLRLFENARMEFLGALNVARSYGDLYRECGILLHLGNCAYELKNLTQAKDCYENALAVYEKSDLKDSDVYARLLCNLANLGLQGGMLDRANLLYRDAYTVAHQVRSLKTQRICIEGQAAIAGLREEWDLAITFYQEALSLSDPQILDTYLYTNLGYCYSQKGSYAVATESLQQALSLCQSASLIDVKASCLFKLGLNAERQDNWDEALEFYRQSYALVESPEAGIGSARLCSQFSKSLAYFLAVQGQKLLEEKEFDPLMDYTLEWTTLIELQGASALGGARLWLDQMLHVVPRSVPCWNNPPKRHLLELCGMKMLITGS